VSENSKKFRSVVKTAAGALILPTATPLVVPARCCKSRDLEKAQTIHTEGHGAEIRLPIDGKSKEQQLAAAGISTSTAHRYEELVGGTPEKFRRTYTMTRSEESGALTVQSCGRLRREKNASLSRDPRSLTCSSRDRPTAHHQAS
jgi:hypothetical protein